MTYTYPWEQVDEVLRALTRRGYRFRLDRAGLTIEWDDPQLTQEALETGIQEWILEDRRRSHRKVRPVSELTHERTRIRRAAS